MYIQRILFPNEDDMKNEFNFVNFITSKQKMQQDMTQHTGERHTRKAPKKNTIIITMKNPQP